MIERKCGTWLCVQCLNTKKALLAEFERKVEVEKAALTNCTYVYVCKALPRKEFGGGGGGGGGEGRGNVPYVYRYVGLGLRLLLAFVLSHFDLGSSPATILARHTQCANTCLALAMAKVC